MFGFLRRDRSTNRSATVPERDMLICLPRKQLPPELLISFENRGIIYNKRKSNFSQLDTLRRPLPKNMTQTTLLYANRCSVSATIVLAKSFETGNLRKHNRKTRKLFVHKIDEENKTSSRNPGQNWNLTTTSLLILGLYAKFRSRLHWENGKKLVKAFQL